MHSSTGGAGELSRREKTIAASVEGGWSVAGDPAILKKVGSVIPRTWTLDNVKSYHLYFFLQTMKNMVVNSQKIDH